MPEVVVWSSVFESLIFVVFALIEYHAPRDSRTRMTYVYYLRLAGIMISGAAMLAAFRWAAVNIPSPSPIQLSFSFWNVAAVYLYYSYCNYWFHRFKHSDHFWWIHKLHHGPQKLTVSMALFRSPIEICANLIFLWFLTKMLIDADWAICFTVLCIEGALEAYHHSNIRLFNKKSWHWMFIQSPGMHVTHHKWQGHSDNYGTISMWDVIFDTINLTEYSYAQKDNQKSLDSFNKNVNHNPQVGLQAFSGFTAARNIQYAGSSPNQPRAKTGGGTRSERATSPPGSAVGAGNINEDRSKQYAGADPQDSGASKSRQQRDRRSSRSDRSLSHDAKALPQE